MKRMNATVVWAVLLILAGVVALLQAFEVIGTDKLGRGTYWEVAWMAIFGVGGLLFMWHFLTDTRNNWWAVIPGLTLLAIAALMALDLLGYAGDGSPWLGALFVGSLAASFLIVYAVRRDHWWAIIPGGILLSVALVALASTWWTGDTVASILFFGMALTFGTVAMMPTPHGRMTWAWIPAGLMAVMGFMVLMAFNSAASYVWALALIGAGVYLLFRQSGTGHITRQG